MLKDYKLLATLGCFRTSNMFDKKLLEINGSKSALIICAIFACLRAVLILGQALFLSQAICELWGSLNTQQVAMQQTTISLALFCACFLVREVLTYAEDAYIDKFARSVVNKLQRAALEKTYEGGPAYIHSQGTPATVALLVEGSDDVDKYVRLAFPKLADCVIVPIVLLIGLFALDLISGLIALVLLPFIFIFMRLIGLSAKNEADKRHSQFEKLSNSFVNKAQGIVDLKAFGADGRFAKIIYDTSEAFRRITMKTLRVSMLSSAVLDLFATLALAAIAIMLGFRMVEGSVAFFPALAVLVIVPDYFKPIREFGSNYHDTLNGKVSLEALLSLIDGADDKANHESPFWADSLKSLGTLEIDTKKRASCAITGPSGIGKTTLLNALAGLTDPPSKFKFVLDGKPFYTLRRNDWQRRIAYITQEPHIFNDTIRNNICFYNPSASDDTVFQALDAVGLSELIDELPKGLNTQIGEGGRALSGGQIERVALCRALVDKTRDVWILDEPSAHIDSITEQELREAVSPLMKDKLAFVVTHSLSWASDMDKTLSISSAHTRNEDDAKGEDGTNDNDEVRDEGRKLL